MNKLRRLAITATLLGFAVLAAQVARAGSPSVMNDNSDQPTTVVIQHEPRSDVDALCGGPNAKVQIDGTGASFPSLPCETVRTDIAIQRLEGRDGWLDNSTRVFLKARLFMHGLGSLFLGLVGLG
jgi:hypothetical protein